MLVAIVGCVEPDVGPPSRIACNGSDSDPGHTVSFGEVQALFGVYCDRCHTPSGPTPIGLKIGGLDLSSFETLSHGGVQSGDKIIVAGDPCASILVQKVGDAPPFGARMPLDGPPFLVATEIQVISDWIAEGAHGE